MIQRLFQIGLVLLLLSSSWIFPAQALDGLQDAQILEVIRSHPQEILDSLIKFQQQESQNQTEKQSDFATLAVGILLNCQESLEDAIG